MKSETSNHFCRVCGFFYKESPPWEEIKGELLSSYDICSCCRVQFGYEDCTYTSVVSFRKKWFEEGAGFHTKEMIPENWNLKDQLGNIPDEWK